MSTRRTIFFDAAGTLFGLPFGVGFHYAHIAEEHGAVPSQSHLLDPVFLDKRFHEVFEAASPMIFPGIAPNALAQAEKSWWHNVVQTVFEGVTFPSFDTFFEALYGFFAKGKRNGEGNGPWSLFPDAEASLEHLSELGHPLGIISNFDSRLELILKSLNIFWFFKTVTISSQEGFEKPSCEIFQRALAKAACAPQDAIYIGDRPDKDIDGARSAGILGVLIDRDGLYPPSKGPASSGYRIRNLQEIDLYL